MKHIYCAGCSVLVAKLADGTKIKRKSIMLCGVCETKRIASDWAKDTKPKSFINDMFDTLGRR